MGAQLVAAADQLALDALVVVELAVDDDVQAFVFVGDRLIAGCQVDNAQPRMPQRDAAVRRDPMPLAVRPAMVQGWMPLRGLDRDGPRRENMATMPHMSA